MDKQVFGRKNVNSQRPRVDRFVMPRDSFTEENIRRSLRAGFDNLTVDIWHAKHQHQKKYKTYLDKAFGLEPMKYQGPRGLQEECTVQPWPCAPRRKSYLSTIDSILDLPSYNYSVFTELLDWSASNLLVAALGRNYHMFSWPAQCAMSDGLTQYLILCCRFDPSGEILLIGTDMGRVELHNSLWCLWCGDGKCICVKMYDACSITAVDWSPTGNSFVTGCSRGTVNTFDRTAVRMHSWQCVNQDPILTIRVSPDARYVAVVILNSPLVQVLTWPSLEYHSSLNCNYLVKTITWHPWRSALLGVGAINNNRCMTIALWDTPSGKVRESTLKHNNYTIDVMLFSHRTGEMVLSLWNTDRSSTDPKSCAELIVMTDPDTVVDRSGEGRGGLDRVRTMVFSPDGTKLATATEDEDLIIWNFLPVDKKKKKTTKSRRFSAIPVYLDQVTQGFVLR